MGKFLNLLGFLAGLVAVLYGVNQKPVATWMIVVGAVLIVITAAVFISAKKKEKDGPSRDSSRSQRRSPLD